jgi:hypothetical protein
MPPVPIIAKTLVVRAVIAATALVLAVAVPAGAGPLRLSAGLGSDARLGANTGIVLSLAVARGLPPVTDVRLLTPAGIGFSTSGLGRDLRAADR